LEKKAEKIVLKLKNAKSKIKTV